jgi:hypothetical protein
LKHDIVSWPKTLDTDLFYVVTKDLVPGSGECLRVSDDFDKSLIGSLKLLYSEEVRTFLRSRRRPVISHCDVAEIIGIVHLKPQTEEKSVKGV